MVKKFEGKISKVTLYESTTVRFLVDAEPHIMQRIRKIFDNSQNYWNQGEYTHKPIVFGISLSSCRDLVWLMDRYNFDVDEALLKEITDKANEYDDIVRNVSNADQDSNYRITKNAIPLSSPLRDYQVQFLNMFRKMKRMLLGDKMGLGKTVEAISVLQEPEDRPALIVVPTHLCTQWEAELKRFLPSITIHVIRGFKNYELPKVDVVITSYNRLAPWQDILLSPQCNFATLIMDEVHELRHTGTGKREICKKLSERVKKCLGLSGTPILNYGSEIWSVLDVIKDECLGTEDEFNSEWCVWGKVNEPATLNSFLKKQGLYLRRTPEMIGLKFGEASKHVFTIDSDLDKLKEVQNVAKMLALSVLSGNVGEDSQSAREFDWKLRHATGVAKAKPVAEFVKMLVEQGEKIVLAGWHRDVYEIWEKEFSGIRTVMFTGSESIADKDRAKKEFVEGDAKIFIVSLRSGAGLDGLQYASSTVVFGELDWSPHIMDQIVARVDRDGQTKHVQAYYLTIADGADPFMIQVLGVKRSQHEGVIEGKVAEGALLEGNSAGKDRIKEMAAAYLNSIGEEIPEIIEETGILGEIANIVRRTKLPNNDEIEMQDALDPILRRNLGTSATIDRESKISKRSRIDFMITKDKEKIGLECKIESTDRKNVYRQVRRYIEEAGVTGVVLAAPWHGIGSFKVDGVPVIIVDTNINSI